MGNKADTATMEHIRTICLAIIATGVLGAGLYWFASALVPFVIAVFFHFSLAPHRLMQRPASCTVAGTATAKDLQDNVLCGPSLALAVGFLE